MTTDLDQLDDHEPPSTAHHIVQEVKDVDTSLPQRLKLVTKNMQNVSTFLQGSRTTSVYVYSKGIRDTFTIYFSLDYMYFQEK